jgi:hypothetical protein
VQESEEKKRKSKGCFVFCTTQWMQRHTTSHMKNKNRRSFSVGEAKACTSPGVLPRYL